MLQFFECITIALCFLYTNNEYPSIGYMEQLLVMLVGIADTFVISFVEESAVSGVSLVNSFNTIFIFLFTALASGGAVIISQYLGRKDQDAAGESGSQLLMISILFSVAMSAVILVFNEKLMRLMFGKVEDGVMEACLVYLRISAYSYPALAVYNAGRRFAGALEKPALPCIFQ